MTKDADEIFNRALDKLNEKKLDLLERTRRDFSEMIESIPEDILNLPFGVFLSALEKSYKGNEFVCKKRNKMKKKDSIVIQVDGQSFILDGDELKPEGNYQPGKYTNLLQEINNVLNKYNVKKEQV